MSALSAPFPVFAQVDDATEDSAEAMDGGLVQSGQSGAGQKVNLERIQQKYWTKGDESEFRVVQNRYYKKSRKVEIGAYWGLSILGSASSDPFIKVRQTAVSLGYHFSEYFAFNLLYWKYSTSQSSAYNDFKSQTTTVQVNSNPPNHFYGAELMFSPIYGKLSVLGKMIAYYDLHVLGGVGRQNTFSGTYTAPLVGLGQQVYVAKNLSIRLDFRSIFYKERVLEQYGTTEFPVGTVRGTRNNQSSVVMIGATYLFGGEG